MKISILLPFKNAEPWLKETIASIVEQIFTDWELVCINDHSTDNGTEIIRDFKDSRIQVIQNDGIGIIAALQLGLKSSQGEFITRMDADDLMPLNRLQIMHDRLIHTPKKTIVTGKVKYFAEGKLSDGFLNYQNWVNNRIDNQDHYKHIYRECVVASPNWMARKQDLIDYDLFDKLNYPEDYDLVFQWFENNFVIESLSDVTLLWRDHPTRTSKNSDTYNQEALFRLKINWFVRLLDKDKSLALLGAGTKGKLSMELLQSQKVQATWYDLNYKNYKAPLFGAAIQDYNQINEDLLLISIYPKNQTDLLKFMEAKGYTIGENAWFL
ncbi:MAG: glycosyltransferase involved in cell wall biosynthesis [Crocinitomicaceae bacterium]|jgi:glycosyltransferase involved in cell wall biosynthesis